MGHLPDELWLLVFKYLHQIDILYGFFDINQYFQLLTVSYIRYVDLSYVSFIQYNRFCDNILPKYHDLIQSLKLKNHYQFRLFKENIFKMTNTLESLTFESNDFYQWKNYTDEIEFYFKDFKKLTNLQFIGRFTTTTDSNLFSYVNQISTLETLVILTESSNSLALCKIQPMSNLSIIKVNLIDFMDLIYLIKTNSQIKEIYMSVHNIHIPDNLDTMINNCTSSLQKLHIEFGSSYTIMLFKYKFVELITFFNNLFRIFHIQLHSFVLIMSLIMSEKLLLLSDVNELKQLNYIPSFQYLIHTRQQPKLFEDFGNIQHLPDDTYLLYTTNRPISFIEDIFPYYYTKLCILDQASLPFLYNVHSLFINSDLSEEISFSFKLFKLQKLAGYCLGTSTKRKLFHTIILLSPNLKHLCLNSNQPKQLIEIFELCNKSLNKIISFECGGYGLYSTFFIQIGKIMPYLRHLKLCNINIYNEITPKLVISHIQQYCPQLNSLHWISLKENIVSNPKKRYMYQEFTELLDEKQKYQHIWYSHGTNVVPNEDYTNIWF